MLNCKCRNCNKIYDESKGTANYKGYCSQKCLHEKAKQFGYSVRLDKTGSNLSEYRILKTANQIGSLYI